ADVTRFKAAEEELRRDVAAARESEDRLRLLQAALEHASDAVMITTPGLEPPDPLVLYVNPAFTRLTGYTLAALSGRSARVLHGEKTERDVLEKMKRELRLGRPACGETYSYRKDGGESRAEWTISPIHDRRGRVTHWMATQRDVTRRRRQEEERRLVEEALRVSEARHRALTEALPDFVLRIGRDGTYLDCRGGRSEPLRQRPAEILGRRLVDVLPPDLAARIGRGIDRALDSGEIQVVEYELAVRGEARSFEARLVQAGTHEVLAVVRDITERRRSEERQGWLQAVVSKAAQEWQLTVDSIASPLLLLEPEGRILRMNEAARRLAGVAFQDAVMKPLARLGHGEPWKTIEALLAEVSSRLTTANVQVSDRKGRTWDVAVSPVSGRSRPLRLIAFAQDVEAGLSAPL
ncbi:MAG TPA: PAS domain S-box protein, partial [Thermoanaerobaculia bacterium]